MTNFSQHLHFIGHSFGTIVNAYACDYVHGRLPDGDVNLSNAWVKQFTTPHVTLMDEGELANVGGILVFVGGDLVAQIAALKRLVQGYGIGGVTTWKDPIPQDFSWIDNYISAVGFQRLEAVNVSLITPTLRVLGGPRIPLSIDAHGAAHLWYRDSIGANPPIGFGSSLEVAGSFPPTGVGTSASSLWWEAIDSSDAFDITQTKPDLGGAFRDAAFSGSFPLLSVIPFVGSSFVQPLDQLGQFVLSGYEAGIEWAGNVGETVILRTGQVTVETTEKVGLWWDAAYDQATDVINQIDPDALLTGPLAAPVFRIRLRTQPAPAPLSADAQAASSTGSPAYAWLTVHVPDDAGLMAFDFTMTGDPEEERIACAINEENVFTLPAKLAPNGHTVSTDMIDVSSYAGQSVELFFGLTGGTSSNCEVAVEGIRFITIPTPKLAMGLSGGNVVVKWPAASIGWILESSATLAPGSWQAEPLDSGVTLEGGVLTLEQPISGLRKFYRLRREP